MEQLPFVYLGKFFQTFSYTIDDDVRLSVPKRQWRMQRMSAINQDSFRQLFLKIIWKSFYLRHPIRYDKQTPPFNNFSKVIGTRNQFEKSTTGNFVFDLLVCFCSRIFPQSDQNSIALNVGCHTNWKQNEATCWIRYIQTIFLLLWFFFSIQFTQICPCWCFDCGNVGQVQSLI